MTYKKSCEILTESDMQDLLALKFKAPEYAFLPQVRSHTGYSAKTTRTADALAFGLWPSRGLDLHGFEIKRSKTDLKKELEQPEKADEIAAYCDYWWLVVSEKKLIEGLIIPTAWGVMGCDKRKLKIIKQAEKLNPKPLDRKIICGVMRKVQEYQTPEAHMKKILKKATRKAHDEGFACGQKLKAREKEEHESLRATVKEFEQQSGINLAFRWRVSERARRAQQVWNLIMKAELNGGGVLSMLEYLGTHAQSLKAHIDAVLAEVEKLQQEPKEKKGDEANTNQGELFDIRPI